MFIVITGGLLFLTYYFTVIMMSGFVFLGFALVATFYSLFLKRIFEKAGAKISFKEEEEEK